MSAGEGGSQQRKYEHKAPDLKKNEYETRIVIIAQGIQFHDEDVVESNERFERAIANPREDKAQEARRQKLKKQWKLMKPYQVPAFDYLSKKLGSDFEVEEDRGKISEILSDLKIAVFDSVRKVGRYTSEKQKVKFVLVQVFSKKDFKKALETEEPQLHVVYQGHSRYGRGACFDPYTGTIIGSTEGEEGRQWEAGPGDERGMFRLGYPYVPVSLNDIKEHKYLFSPVPVEEGLPPSERSPPFSRHPHARRALKKIALPPALGDLVWTDYKSPSNQYYGVFVDKEDHLLVHAGWEGTDSDPYDLGATDLKCKVFCHFGCSSRLHYWEIVRKREYKGWEKPSPPTDRYAYFTTAVAYYLSLPIWLHHLLSYDKKNNFKPWRDSLEETKRKANASLRRSGTGFELY